MLTPRQSLQAVVADSDEDGLEHIIVSMFDFHLDYQHVTQLRGVKADYVSMAKQGLRKGHVRLRKSAQGGSWTDEQVRTAAPFVRSLIQSRGDGPSDEELVALRCPLLLLTASRVTSLSVELILIVDRKIRREDRYIMTGVV